MSPDSRSLSGVIVGLRCYCDVCMLHDADNRYGTLWMVITQLLLLLLLLCLLVTQRLKTALAQRVLWSVCITHRYMSVLTSSLLGWQTDVTCKSTQCYLLTSHCCCCCCCCCCWVCSLVLADRSGHQLVELTLRLRRLRTFSVRVQSRCTMTCMLLACQSRRHRLPSTDHQSSISR